MSYESYERDEIVVGQSISFMNLKAAISIELEIDEISHIGIGYSLVLDCHTSHIAVKFAEILNNINKCLGKELEKEAKFLKNGDAGMVKLIPTKPMVVETFAEYPTLGRFTVCGLRSKTRTLTGKKEQNKLKKWRKAILVIARIAKTTRQTAEWLFRQPKVSVCQP
ncbi:elongation factor 1-alpha-like [Solanum verrucosum]|uniref:elongation factor 1-alpha-like n=1 Tax=Solanum verrucosum TaxID=315347 RepID=UPI0020D016B3|nr:elongation factor 1-alpha-like [Solanum verrucosum]